MNQITTLGSRKLAFANCNSTKIIFSNIIHDLLSFILHYSVSLSVIFPVPPYVSEGQKNERYQTEGIYFPGSIVLHWFYTDKNVTCQGHRRQ